MLNYNLPTLRINPDHNQYKMHLQRHCFGLEQLSIVISLQTDQFSFRDADVVPFTFDLDFPEGLSCRESTVDESGGKTVPYRPWK